MTMLVDPVPGSVLNGIYRIDRFIARGGMGVVYAGTNIETGDKVAIKIVAAHLAIDPRILAKVRDEARLLTQVVHPAVVPYRVFARDPGLNVHYIVTDLVIGETLCDLIDGRKADVADLLALLRRLAEGLWALHAVGAIHCDVAPDNILLPAGQIELARIVDLGIAKSFVHDKRTIVLEGFAGKLGYAAPEQFGVGGSAVGPWTDVYGLGLVALAVALGRPADMGGTLAEAVEKRRHLPPLDDVPSEIRGLLRDMLAPDTARRLGSMKAVLYALDAIEARVTGDVGTPAARSAMPAAPFSQRLDFGRRASRMLAITIFGITVSTSSSSVRLPNQDARSGAADVAVVGRYQRGLARQEGSRGKPAAFKAQASSTRNDLAKGRHLRDGAVVVVAPKAVSPPHRQLSLAAVSTRNDLAKGRHLRDGAVVAVAPKAASPPHRQLSLAAVKSTADPLVRPPPGAALADARQEVICRRYDARDWRTIGTVPIADCVRRGFARARTIYLQVGGEVLRRYHGRFFIMRGKDWLFLPSATVEALTTGQKIGRGEPSGEAHTPASKAALASTEIAVCRHFDGAVWKTLSHLPMRHCVEQAFAQPGTGFVQSGETLLSRRANRIGVGKGTNWRAIAWLGNEDRSHVTVKPM